MTQLIQKIIHAPPTLHQHHVATRDYGMGVGYVEGWRGPIVMIVSMSNNQVHWCHFHDASWQNWLAVEYAVSNNIVADFPLINKSFNLSYSGHDS